MTPMLGPRSSSPEPVPSAKLARISRALSIDMHSKTQRTRKQMKRREKQGKSSTLKKVSRKQEMSAYVADGAGASMICNPFKLSKTQ